jgi:uncharacterized protein (TIGR03067 family)
VAGGEQADLSSEITLHFKGTQAILQIEKIKLAFAIQLGPDYRPKIIDLTDDKDTVEGIYELGGDTLRLCVSKPAGARERSTAFQSREGSEDTLVTLRRRKP